MWANESINQSIYSSSPIHRNSNVIHLQSHQLHCTTDEACEDTTIKAGSLKFVPACRNIFKRYRKSKTHRRHGTASIVHQVLPTSYHAAIRPIQANHLQQLFSSSSTIQAQPEPQDPPSRASARIVSTTLSPPARAKRRRNTNSVSIVV